MKIVLLTGSHPRHAFVARAVARSGGLAGWVIERREEFVPPPPEHLPPATRALFVRHFAERAASERRFFGTADTEAVADTADTEAGVPRIEVSPQEINSPAVQEFIRRHAGALLLSYGIHKLAAPTLAAAGPLRWNIHGGLSPWYRGAITHFWPSYFLEPQMTGMTVHELSDQIDGGAVIHQTAAELVHGDGLHDLACRAVMGLAAELPRLLELAAAGRLQAPRPQTTPGRIWRAGDWRPEHLHVIYDLLGNAVVDRYLSGDFAQRPPQLVRQF